MQNKTTEKEIVRKEFAVIRFGSSLSEFPKEFYTAQACADIFKTKRETVITIQLLVIVDKYQVVANKMRDLAFGPGRTGAAMIYFNSWSIGHNKKYQ